MTWNGREEEAEKKQLLMRKMDDCRLAVTRDRGDGRKFAENPRDSKSDVRITHAYALKEGSVAYH